MWYQEYNYPVVKLLRGLLSKGLLGLVHCLFQTLFILRKKVVHNLYSSACLPLISKNETYYYCTKGVRSSVHIKAQSDMSRSVQQRK